MDIRALPVGQGLTWFKQAIDLGGRNPRAVFGAALLLIASLYATAMLTALIAAAMVGGGAEQGAPAAPDMRAVLLIAVPLFLLIMFLVPILMGGLMHVIREAEAGRPVRARDVFAPLRERSGRRLALLGLVQVGLAFVGGLVFVAIAGSSYWTDYMAAMRGAMSGTMPVVPQPDNAGLLFLVQLLFNYFSYALMLFSIPLMLFSGLTLVDALRSSLRASVRNIGANLLAGVLFAGALIVAALLVALLMGLVGLIGNLVHGSVGSLLILVVGLGFASVVLVMLVGGAYLAWRDTFGDAAAPPLPEIHGIEV
ncbi:MAG: BPSS1780 family membrane protein [Pseudomonadota bacterium]